MQIGVISDTHMREADDLLRQVAAETFRDVSLVLHAGDLTRIDILDAFAGKRCIAVRGNMDRKGAEPLGGHPFGGRSTLCNPYCHRLMGRFAE